MDSSKYLGIIYCFRDFPTRPFRIVNGPDSQKIYWKCSGGSGIYGTLKDWIDEVLMGSIIVLHDPVQDGEIN